MNQTDSEIKIHRVPRTNIPTVLTSFIGRKREIAEVVRLLASSRLVTLTGAAGCGKTRLAVRAAAEVSGPQARFASGRCQCLRRPPVSRRSLRVNSMHRCLNGL